LWFDYGGRIGGRHRCRTGIRRPDRRIEGEAFVGAGVDLKTDAAFGADAAEFVEGVVVEVVGELSVVAGITLPVDEEIGGEIVGRVIGSSGKDEVIVGEEFAAIVAQAEDHH